MGEEVDFASFEKHRIDELKEYFNNQVHYQLNLAFDPRIIIGDDYSDAFQKFYGN